MTSTGPSERDRQAIYASYGLTCPPRYATLRDPTRPTYGGKVAKIAAKLGTPLMPWQRYSADTALEVYPDTGLPVYRKVGITVPRQSGKTSLILPVASHRAMAWQRQRIVYAAQSGTAAREKWEDDHVQALVDVGWAPAEDEPLRAHHRVKVRRANGREAIVWRKTRSLHGLHANTERSGHGKTLHLGLLDEYFAQVDYRIFAAWSPAMITVPAAQSWWFSTAGTSKSVPLNEARKRGRELVEAGEPSQIAYIDWSAPEGADYTDPAVWLGCMPAVCPYPPPCRCSPDWRHTVTVDTIRAELEDTSTPAKLAEFLRAYMNWTREDNDAEADPNVPPVEMWDLLADESAAGGDVVALSAEISIGRDHASISAVGEGPAGPDGPPRGVVLEDGPGIEWLMPRIVELNARLRPVAWAVDERSPTTTLVQQMDRAGIPRMGKEPRRGELWIPTVPQLTAACGAFADRVRQGSFVHLGQRSMSAALAVAKTRVIGDGAWAWGRRLGGDGAPITSLTSMTLALAGYERFKQLAVDYDALANIW